MKLAVSLLFVSIGIVQAQSYPAGTYYLPPGGGAAPSATESAVQGFVAVAGSISNFSVNLSAAPGVGVSAAFTWRDNGSSKAVTCTISGASATACVDSTHSFSTSANDLIDIQMVVSGGTLTATIVSNWNGGGSGGGGGGAASISCVGTPGNTTGSYRQLCQTGAGALFACNNAAGCTVAADWVAQSGGDTITSPNATITVGGTSSATHLDVASCSVTSSIMTCTNALVAPSFTGSGSNPYINFPSNTTHTGAAGDLWNNAGILNFGATPVQVVTGPASATAGHIATFSGTSGAIIQDGGAAGTGTVTSVAGNNGLTGTVTTTGNIGLVAIANNAMLCNNSGGSAVPTTANCTVTGTGNAVMATSPTLITPALGTPSALVLTNATGLAIGGTPLTTSGDLLFANATPALARLAIGSNGQCLTVSSSLPAWGSCGGSSGLTINSTTITSGATNAILYGDGTLLQNEAGVTRTAAGQFTFTKTALGTTPADSIELVNTTAAANNAQQISPSVHWEGQGWKTTSTAASQAVDWIAYALPIQGSTSPTSQWLLNQSINGGAYATALTVVSGNNTSLYLGSNGNAGAGIGDNGTASLQFLVGSAFAEIDSVGMQVKAAFGFGWSSSGSVGGGNYDTILCRPAAGVVEFGTTTCNASGNLKLTPGSTVTSDVNVCWQSGNALTQGAACGTSLLAYKENIQPLTHGLDYVMAMKPVTFDWKDANHVPVPVLGQHDVGMIADWTASLDPLMGAYDKDGKLYNFRDRTVMTYLIKAVQEQQAEIESLRLTLSNR